MDQIKRCTWQALSFVLITLSLNCSYAPEPRLVEIVALDRKSPHNFSLVTSTFIDPPHLPKLANHNINMIAGAKLDQDLIGIIAQDSSSFVELTKRLQESMGYQAFRVDVSVENGVARGRSFESVMALSAFSHFEKIFTFAKEHGCTTQFKRPLNVAIYGEIASSSNLGQPISKNDNALYVGSADTAFLLPLGREHGLPLTMHEGVLAHEFHHRIFFNEVWDNPNYEHLYSLFQSRYDNHYQRLEKRSRIVLNALDEGLADIFAVAFTGIPDYLNISLSQKATENLRKQRDLGGQFAETVTYDQLADGDLASQFIIMCGEESNDFTNPKFNVYCLGTVIAKTMYDAASRDVHKLRDEIVPLMLAALSSIPARLDQGLQFDLDIFFEDLARRAGERSPDLQKRLCAQYKRRFLSLATSERLPSCTEFLNE